MAEKEITKKEIEAQIKIWEKFVEFKNSQEEEKEKFIINPDKNKVRMLARGVLENEANHKFKYCPCRLSTGDREKDLKLVCPCRFKLQKTWKEKGECWCSLFIKKSA